MCYRQVVRQALPAWHGSTDTVSKELLGSLQRVVDDGERVVVRRGGKRVAAIVPMVALVIFGFLSSSCSSSFIFFDPTYHSSGTARIESYRVYDERDADTDDEEGIERTRCTTFYSVTNTGETPIEEFAISFRIETDRGAYLKTETRYMTIPPKKTVYADMTITFFEHGEIIATDSDVSIVEWFFVTYDSRGTASGPQGGDVGS